MTILKVAMIITAMLITPSNLIKANPWYCVLYTENEAVIVCKVCKKRMRWQRHLDPQTDVSKGRSDFHAPAEWIKIYSKDLKKCTRCAKTKKRYFSNKDCKRSWKMEPPKTDKLKNSAI